MGTKYGQFNISGSNLDEIPKALMEKLDKMKP
jgi:hypothetical protein